MIRKLAIILVVDGPGYRFRSDSSHHALSAA